MNQGIEFVFGQCVNPDCNVRVCSAFWEDPLREHHCLNCYCNFQCHELLGHLNDGVLQVYPKTEYIPKVFQWETICVGTSTAEDSVVETETTIEEDEDGELFELTKTRYVYDTPSNKKRSISSTMTLRESVKESGKKARSGSSSSK